MVKNFQLGQSIELILDEHCFDLHNCYNLEEISILDNKVVFRFEPDIDFGKTLPPILISFIRPTFLTIDHTLLGSSLRYLDQMGYKNPNDFDEEWLLEEKEASEEDHFLFQFVNGSTIRIFAEQAITQFQSSRE